jgi:hypothetical protein
MRATLHIGIGATATAVGWVKRSATQRPRAARAMLGRGATCALTQPTDLQRSKSMHALSQPVMAAEAATQASQRLAGGGGVHVRMGSAGVAALIELATCLGGRLRGHDEKMKVVRLGWVKRFSATQHSRTAQAMLGRGATCALTQSTALRPTARAARALIVAVVVGAMLGSAPAALACRATNPNPNERQLASLPEGHVGVIGKVVRSYWSEQTKSNGEAVVLVEVQKSFGKSAPEIGSQIYILNPGCCSCVSISTIQGDIVHAGLVGMLGVPFVLSWPRP